MRSGRRTSTSELGRSRFGSSWAIAKHCFSTSWLGKIVRNSCAIGAGARAIAEQLVRSAGSVSANVEEGHGRGYGKQRNLFFMVSIGSARESKGWYWRARHLVSSEVLDHRLALADEVIALLVTELRRQKSR